MENLNKEKYFKDKLKENNFYELTNKFIDCIEVVNMNCFSLCSITNRRILFNKTPGFSSSQYTLKVLDKLIFQEDFIDVFVLLRKIRDNILFNCCLLSTTLIKDLTEEQYFKYIDKSYNLEEILEDLFIYNKKDVKDNGYLDLFYDDVINEDKYKSIRRTKIDYSKYISILENKYNCLKNKNTIFDDLKSLDIKLNGYVHGNGISFLSNEYIVQKTGYDGILDDIKNVIKILLYNFIFLIYLVDSRILIDTDYIDSFEMGLNNVDNEIEIHFIIDDVIKCIINENKNMERIFAEENVYSMKY